MKEKGLKFFVYARKSTDRGDNQIESLPDQIKVLRRLASEKNLKIVDILEESKSAKKPNNRPIFSEMIERIRNGEANGIICWKLDRLARNPIDAGTVSWMLQEGTIKQINTFEKEYRPEDNVLMMSVEMGMANQYSKDLSLNVSRSVLSKFERGEYPSRAPIGYMNIRESKKKAYVDKDPMRYELVRKMWDLMLTGNYNPRQIADIANNDWGLTTRERGKFKAKKLGYANTYVFFGNLFYAGYLTYRGQQYKASHPAMVTMEEFERVQVLMGNKIKTRAQTKEFPFTGIIKCEECGCAITAEQKIRINKNSEKKRIYTYYHCTHRKQDYKCSQIKCLSANELESQILDDIALTKPHPLFYEYATKKLKRANEEEFKQKASITESLHQVVKDCDDRLERLLDTKIEGLIESGDFIKRKERINIDRTLALEKLEQAESKIQEWSDKLEKAVDFVMFAQINFLNGDKQTKREILNALGKNLTIKDQILNVGDRNWREPFVEIAKVLKQKNARLEPALSRSGSNNNDMKQPLDEVWWTRQDSNLRPPQCK